jgi:diadenosine tetraphosphatase ApaH/serine/threonine PP2A family protein phosphatase
LEPLQVLDGLVLCHGSVHDPDFYTTTPREALLSFRVMPQPICLFGHTHCAEWYEYQPMGLGLPLQHPLPDGGVVELREGTMYMINPGAVGQPRDGNSQAACAVLDLERRQVELVRVPYDIARAQEALLAAGLPEAMGARLSFGI